MTEFPLLRGAGFEESVQRVHAQALEVVGLLENLRDLGMESVDFLRRETNRGQAADSNVKPEAEVSLDDTGAIHALVEMNLDEACRWRICERRPRGTDRKRDVPQILRAEGDLGRLDVKSFLQRLL